MPQDQRLMPTPNELDSFSDISQRMPVVEPISREQPNLREYLDALLKRKWLIAGIVITTTLLVALHMYRLPSIYQAETTIRIEPKNESFLRSKDIVINTGNDPAYRQTQLRLLENPQLMRQLTLTLDLQHDPPIKSLRRTSNSSICFSSGRRNWKSVRAGGQIMSVWKLPATESVQSRSARAVLLRAMRQC